MRLFSKWGAFALCFAIAGALAPSVVLAAPPTPFDFAREPAISDVSLSRDGKHIVALTSPDGQTVNISVWQTDNLTAPPTVLAASKMRFKQVGFLKDDRLYVTAIQTFTVGADREHLTKTYVTDLKGSEWKPLLPATHRRAGVEEVRWINSLVDATLLDPLPLDPQNVLVIDNRVETDGDVLRVNIYTGEAQRVERASGKIVSRQTDLKGEIRGRQKLDYDNEKVYFAQQIRHPDTGAWEEHFRWYAKDREPMEIVGFSEDPNIAYLATSKGRDKVGIYEYDIRNRRVLEPLFEHKLFEAGDLLRSTSPSDYGRLLGFTYEAESPRTYWVDEKISGLDKGLRDALQLKSAIVDWRDPASGETAKIATTDGATANIIGWNANRNLMLVEKSGPKQPPEYYLLTNDGKLILLGRSRPQMDLSTLGDTRLVQYAARDGLMIPAFLTTPPTRTYGPGPYPTLILPHGGPWARDFMEWDISGWTQYFATRGYAVLQPQFRGSEGWGQRLWRAGDNEWGQKMQDDKDDGAKWLIAQKIAAPDRIAMFGYSYGGYAALAAAVRPNGLYQCAISGAGAPDLGEFKKETYENPFQREFQNPTVGGLDVLKVARTTSIPVFLYHGDRDQIVDIQQSERFARELKAAGKPYKFTRIADMGHQYFTMVPSMLEQQLVDIEAYLKTDCGAGGL